jgi:glycosyltransferase involved in cell wall biosynthesis
MKISVVMAVKDGEPFLARAIDSVLAQTLRDFEFLIVDDASSDGTPALLQSYRSRDSRIRLLRNERNLGVYPSLNAALAQAKGEVIARHDADDLSTADRFDVQFQALQSTPRCSLVIAAYEVIYTDTQGPAIVSRPSPWQPRLEWDLLFTNAVGAGAHVMFPRAVDGSPVRYPGRRRYAEDYALWCHLVRKGAVVCPAPVLYQYRQHGNSISNRHGVQQAECLAGIRHEYQALYTGPDVPVDAAAELSRFWLLDGRSIPGNLRRLEALLTRLRHGFLGYVEQRYGVLDRAALAEELDTEIARRLGYWLSRSIKLRDANGLWGFLGMAGRERRVLRASAAALRHAGVVATRRLRTGGEAAS